jgi:hypothetical protein
MLTPRHANARGSQNGHGPGEQTENSEELALAS